ncbi:MAG: hypothetical protein ACYDCL_04595 [Myxococcales bacterium]
MRTPVLASLLALAVSSAAASSEGSARAGGWSVDLVDASGRKLPTFAQDGRTYVLGEKGQRYSLRIHNRSPLRVEAVASVDGRDALDGRPSDWSKRGYLVLPYGQVVIDGFRLDDSSVAAFRFSSVARSYASQMGDARDVGAIGVAIFPERRPPPPPQVSAEPPSGWYREKSLATFGDAAGGRRHGLPAREVGSAPQASLAAPAPEGRAKRERPGLGTEFGEQRESPVTQVAFERESSSPSVVLSLRYDDRQGLLAMGIDLDRGCGTLQTEASLRETADPFRRNEYAQPPPGWNCR